MDSGVSQTRGAQCPFSTRVCDKSTRRDEEMKTQGIDNDERERSEGGISIVASDEEVGM